MTNPKGKWSCKYKCGKEFATYREAVDHEKGCSKKPPVGKTGNKKRRVRY